MCRSSFSSLVSGFSGEGAALSRCPATDHSQCLYACLPCVSLKLSHSSKASSSACTLSTVTPSDPLSPRQSSRCPPSQPRSRPCLGLEDCPMVHLDKSGEIDCYFTEAGATVVPGASHH